MRRTRDFLSALGWLAALAYLIFLSAGCAAAKETAKKDWELSKDFTACDSEAKAVARVAPSCAKAIDDLIDLMQQPECKNFPSSAVDGGITIGGVTYVCHE